MIAELGSDTQAPTDLDTLLDCSAPPDRRAVLHLLRGLAGTISAHRQCLDRLQAAGNRIWTECEAGRMSAEKAIEEINALHDRFPMA